MRHVDIRRRRDLAEVDVEAVREHERLAGGHVRRDVVVVEVALDVIGDQDHDHVGGLGGVGGGQDLEAGGFGLRASSCCRGYRPTTTSTPESRRLARARGPGCRSR